MSWRTSFITKFIFNDNDYKKLRKLLKRSGFDITCPLTDSFFDWELHVISGYISTLHDYVEVDLIDILSGFKPKEEIKIILIKEGGDVLELIINTKPNKPIEVYELVRGNEV